MKIQMSLEQATEILKEEIQAAYTEGGLYDRGHYLAYSPGDKDACLDDRFTADQLEAIAVWMRAHP